MHRALPDSIPSSSIVIEAYTSALFTKTDDSNATHTTTWSTMDGKLIGYKMRYSCDLFTFRMQSQGENSTRAFNMDNHSESSRTYDMIIGKVARTSSMTRRLPGILTLFQ
jgi:hypothetical protein